MRIMKLMKKPGVLILEQIKFDYIFKRKVIRNNKTSGKITLPQELIGEYVYIVAKAMNDEKDWSSITNNILVFVVGTIGGIVVAIISTIIIEFIPITSDLRFKTKFFRKKFYKEMVSK